MLTHRCAIIQQSNNRAVSFSCFAPCVFFQAPDCKKWVFKTDAASAAPYTPTQRKESLLSSLYLAHWPCFCSVPFCLCQQIHSQILQAPLFVV